MTKRDFVKERCDRAIEAFKNHELVDNREDRWRIAKRYPDGKIDCVHAAEIVSLWGGRIYVGGDIDDCVFAYYSSSGKGETPREQHIAKLRWMGCHTDVSYYVRQKASLGLTDGGKYSWMSSMFKPPRTTSTTVSNKSWSRSGECRHGRRT